MASLALLPPKGITSPQNAAKITGKKFQIAPNSLNVESISLVYKEGNYHFMLKDISGEHKVVCGVEKWAFGQTDLPRPNLVSSQKIKTERIAKIAASAAWKDANTFEISLRYYESPHRNYIICQFEGESVKVSFDNSINRMSGAKDKRPVLEGKMIS